MEKFLGLHEIRTSKFIKAVLCEFLATGILLITGYGSCITINGGQPFIIIISAFVSGMTVAFIIWTFNHVSGAHINPVLTLSFLVTGHISMAKAIAYIIAQSAGAIAGSATIWYMAPEPWRTTAGIMAFAEGVTLGQGFAVEAVSTFLLLLGVFATSDQYRNDHTGSLPLAIGLLIFSQIAWAGNLTGGCMNPARAFGPAVITGAWRNHWVYWVAPCVGGCAGSLLYEHVLAQTPHGADMSIQIEPTKDVRKKSLDIEKFANNVIIVETNKMKSARKKSLSDTLAM